jgi:hypothetical protein
MADKSGAAIRLIRKQIAIAGSICLATLTSAILFCYGCSAHETAHWGHEEDSITHALALGTYLSGLVFIGSLVVLVVGLFELRPFSKQSKPE